MRTTAIVAAYNEEKTLAAVLQALTHSSLIDEVIVVSDGSSDATVEVARTFDVRTVALKENHGKGYAMAVGVANSSNDVLFFCDGDMFNITEDTIESLIGPVTRGECDMNVGIRDRGPTLNFFHLKAHFGPILSGIRVMRRKVFDTVPVQYQSHYKIEAALNCFCARADYRQQNTVIYDLGHITKESKRGVLDGLRSRWDMSREVFLLIFELYVFQPWRWMPEPELPVAEYDLFE